MRTCFKFILLVLPLSFLTNSYVEAAPGNSQPTSSSSSSSRSSERGPATTTSDFGSELIVSDDPLNPGGRPLPVELVEDRGAPALLPVPSSSLPNSAKEAVVAPRSAAESLSEPDTKSHRRVQSYPMSGLGGPATGNTRASGEQRDYDRDPLSQLSQDPNDDPGVDSLASLPNPDQVVTEFNVGKVDITALIKTFGILTKRNYILDPNVKGEVVINQNSPLTLGEALKMLESILLLKGFTSVPLGNNIWKIVPAKDARQTTIPLRSGASTTSSDALVTQLIRLKYIPAEDLQQLFAQFVSKDGMINSLPATNSLVLIDSSANIERLKKLISQLDTPAVDQDITIIPIQHAEAKDIAEKILEILGEKDGDSKGGAAKGQTKSTPRPAVIPQPGATSSASNVPGHPAGAEAGERRLPLKIIPDERINSIIVVADADMTVKVRALVEQLDSELDRSAGRFFVYRLKHADAEELSDILNQLISGSAPDRSSSGNTTGSSLSRSSRDSSRSRDRDGLTDRSRSSFAPTSRGRLATGGTGGDSGRDGASSGAEGKVNLEGEVIIAPDPSTNSLVINAGKQDYQKLKPVIDALDVKRRQVVVEATILEVSLDHSEGMGIELQGTVGTSNGGVFGQTNFGGLSNVLSNPQQLSDLSIAAASSGTLTLPGGIVIPSQAALLSAVSRNRNANVLSSPTILTTDNQEAEIIVGENRPFVSSTSTDPSNLNNTFNSVERQDIGITLRITPQISTGDFVTLRIFVEVSGVLQGTENDRNGPSTTIRTTETEVEVKDGQMIVTGGLISDDVTDAERGVPFFQDIPVLGNYFKRQDRTRIRKNLLVFITPKVIRDQFDAREFTVDRRDSLESTIEQQGAEPSREDILERKQIDSVAERLPPGKRQTTPVTAPEELRPHSRKLATGSETLRAAPTRGSALAPQDEASRAALDRTEKLLKGLSTGAETSELPAAPPITPPARGLQNTTPSKVEEEIGIRVKPKLPRVGRPTSGGEAAPARPMKRPIVGDTPSAVSTPMDSRLPSGAS